MLKTVYGIFLFLLIFCPLAFGTTEQWSLTIMEALSPLALLLFLLHLRANKGIYYQTPGLTPLLILLGYILVQLIPLPAAVVKLISPATFALYNNTIGLLEPVNWMALSINKKATLLEFFRYLAYAGFYILTVQLLSHKEQLQRTVIVITFFAAILSFVAILQLFTAGDNIYWLRYVPANAMIVGPYVCHNHYAGLMEMIVPLVVALFFHYQPQIVYKATMRQRIAEIFSQERTGKYILLGFSALLIITSIFVSLSRGGMISASLSLIFLLFMLKKSEGAKGKRGRVFVIVAIAMVVLSVSWFGWDNIISRFEKLETAEGGLYEARLDFWKDSAGIVKDFPVTGSGFGTFMDIYKGYRTYPGQTTLKNAHNDYLELLTDGGIIAFLLAAWFVGSVLVVSIKTIGKRREKYSIYLFWASIAGILAILIHSVVDFNFHIGANGLYFFFLLGLAVSSSHTRIRFNSRQSLLTPNNFVMRKCVTAALAILCVFILGFVFNSGILRAKTHFKEIKDVYLNVNIPKEKIESIKNIADKAVYYDPMEGRYRYAVANIEMFLPDIPNTIKNYTEAIRKNPTNGEYLQRLAYMKSALTKNVVADQLYLAGIRYDQNNPDMYNQYAQWQFTQGNKEMGLTYIKQAIALNPEKTNLYITSMLINRITDEEIRNAMPQRVAPSLLFADYLHAIGKEEMAEAVYNEGLQHVSSEPQSQKWELQRIYGFYMKVYWHYMRKHQYDEALNILQDARVYLPDDVNVLYYSGVTYEKLGITYRAVEEYEKALTLDPGNRKIETRLAGLKGR